MKMMVEIKNCVITAQMSEEHASVIIALAGAAKANAEAISAIANKARVEIGTGIKIINGRDDEED
jgi:hypothetical protein